MFTRVEDKLGDWILVLKAVSCLRTSEHFTECGLEMSYIF